VTAGGRQQSKPTEGIEMNLLTEFSSHELAVAFGADWVPDHRRRLPYWRSIRLNNLCGVHFPPLRVAL